jgi:hypothetical protein
MAQTERQTRPKKGDRRAICLSNQIGNRDSSESLQPVRLHLITRKNIAMRISQNSSAVFQIWCDALSRMDSNCE